MVDGTTLLLSVLVCKSLRPRERRQVRYIISIGRPKDHLVLVDVEKVRMCHRRDRKIEKVGKKVIDWEVEMNHGVYVPCFSPP